MNNIWCLSGYLLPAEITGHARLAASQLPSDEDRVVRHRRHHDKAACGTKRRPRLARGIGIDMHRLHYLARFWQQRRQRGVCKANKAQAVRCMAQQGKCVTADSAPGIV
jgi:hypothetical protein